MPWRVYEVRGKDRDRLDRALAVDRVSRASIQLREARHFGWDRDSVFVVLEGTDEQVGLADKGILGYGRVPSNAEAVFRRVRWEDEASAASLGSVLSTLPEPAFEPPRDARRRAIVAEAKTTAARAGRRAASWWRRLRRRLGF